MCYRYRMSIIFILALLFIWIVAGLIPYGMNMYCPGYNKSMKDKLIGLLTAITIGPFYFFMLVCK